MGNLHVHIAAIEQQNQGCKGTGNVYRMRRYPRYGTSARRLRISTTIGVQHCTGARLCPLTALLSALSVL